MSATTFPVGASAAAASLDVEAVIINCSTREQTALALASVLQHTGLPVTVVECESTDGSAAYLRALREQLPFRLVEMPLRRHGDTLNRIFRESRRDALLLVDSDAEILRADLAPAMLSALGPGVYGSGFLHPGQWLGANHLIAGDTGYYAPRMWIPCVLLDVPAVRRALESGASFRERVVCNEIAPVPWLARLLYLRFRVPGLRRWRLDALRGHRREHFGIHPHYVYYDTGAALHDALVRRGLAFAALPPDIWAASVRHDHGVTRRRLSRRMRNAADVDATRLAAIQRLESVYGVRFAGGRAH